MFSDRTAHNLTRNRLTQAVEAMRAAQKPYIDLTESNPTRAGFHYPSDLLQPLAQPRALTYEPSPLGALGAREAISREYARQQIDVAPDRIVLTASTSEAYSILFKLLAGAGDEVLVPRPSYPLFDHLTRLDLVVPRPYDLECHGAWSIDFASIERALSPRTRAVLVVSPNNPTGSFVTGPELDRLAALCAARGGRAHRPRRRRAARNRVAGGRELSLPEILCRPGAGLSCVAERRRMVWSDAGAVA